ncbi:hypothetical protein [Pedobacter sp. MR22-3]|uniref:hypothetical protein n=1 Tax=Pedobacter sp. MR22-3 TaxID=2994552 RepID=UPI002245351C|nr:hypothetical protein [Pedobacter sp. MR22-3]MCX2584260.1 hypothetical protein [Pedobacter sp. MR22-3]
MEDFTELTIEILKEYLNKTETKYSTAQKRLCFAKIKRIYRRVKLGYDFGGIKICSDKMIIVEGNHRYIAYLLAEIEIEFITWISSHCDVSKLFRHIEIDEVNDWDYNNTYDRKYCSDDFLINCTKRNIK